MRRALAPAGHRIAASGGYNEQGPGSSCSLARSRIRGRGDSWGAIGSQEALTTIPGGVRFPGAPLSFKIASIYP
jgi:hypothetical protein